MATNRPRRKPGPPAHWEKHPPRVVEVFTGQATEEEVWSRVAPTLAMMLTRLRAKRTPGC